jgi:flagellar protein FliO/FliZ
MKISVIIVLIFFLMPSPFDASQQGGEGSTMVDDWLKNPETNQEDLVKTNNEDINNEPSTPTVTLWDFVKMIFALLFVLLLIYGVLRFINKRNKWFDNGRSVENIGGTNLGNNKSLQLVKVGNSILVVGVGDSINLLKEITDQEEAEGLLKAYKDKTETQAFSSETLVGMMKKFPISKNTSKTKDFSSLLKQQIGQLSQDRKKKIKELDDKEGFKQ